MKYPLINLTLLFALNALSGVSYAALGISVVALIASIYGIARRKGPTPPSA